MTDKMAPNWIMTVKALTKGVLSTPKRLWAIIMWPVLDTGRNSVSPSTIAMMTVCRISISYLAGWSVSLGLRTIA